MASPIKNNMLTYADLDPGKVYIFSGLDNDDYLPLWRGEINNTDTWVRFGGLSSNEIFLVLESWCGHITKFGGARALRALTKYGPAFFIFHERICPLSSLEARVFNLL